MSRDKTFQCKHILDEYVVAHAKLWQLFTWAPGVVGALVHDGFPEKVALRKVERLVGRGLLDYGTSPYFAWPTDEGLSRLHKFAEAHHVSWGTP